MSKKARFTLPVRKKDWSWLTQTPIPIEELNRYAQLDGKKIKNWRDFPHRKWDWIKTDDNWVGCIRNIFNDGSASVCGRWVITPKQGINPDYTFRLLHFFKNRIRFNNRLKILINTAILTGDWFRSYELAYNKQPKDIKEIVHKLQSGGEDYLLQQLDKLLEEHGMTDSFVFSRIKDLCEGKVTVKDKDGKDQRVVDNRITGVVMKDMTALVAKMRGIVGHEPQNLPPISDNRKIEVHNYTEVIRELKEGKSVKAIDE